ncbi:MAG: MerR family transcriptional regulator [Bacteroidales bacterium]|jgi:DNA-binding transcriptional MerR regulator|nr:MerR family transcriptional regulator [Bacteroidales bacterium]
MEIKKLYYRIGEVADMFNVQTSTIRYWESEFDVLRPRKSTKGNRLYTERDLRYLQIIYQLVKVKGYTIQGAKDAMKTKFNKLEENALMIRTLNDAREFLVDLDKQLAEKQKQLTVES